MSRLLLTLALLGVTVLGAIAAPVAAAADNTVFIPLVSGSSTVQSTNNLAVSTATYLGGASADSASAVDIAPDGTVVFAGVLPGYNPGGATPVNLLADSDGAVVRLNRAGTSVLSVARIGNTVSDMEIDDNGQIAVCGDFGVAVLKADASAIVWSAAPGNVSRCAMGRDGTTAALSGGAVYVYNPGGTLIKNWPIGGSTQSDIAVDSANGQVIATGFTQVSGNLQLPFIRAWAYDGTLRWRSYDFPDAPGLGADSRGERIAIGRDGKLYFAGSINGGTGVSVFSRDPKDINLTLGKDRNIANDPYNSPFNIGSVKMAWLGRYNPTTGALEVGTSLLTRRSDGKGNSITPGAITADKEGRVYLAGSAVASIKDRDKNQIAGQTVGPYGGVEAYLLVLSADFTTRIVWTVFTGAGGNNSGATGIGARDGLVAVGATLSRGAFLTHQALQSAPGSTTVGDAYLAVWPQR